MERQKASCINIASVVSQDSVNLSLIVYVGSPRIFWSSDSVQCVEVEHSIKAPLALWVHVLITQRFYAKHRITITTQC
jgi:hypothetical protein